MPLSDGFLGIDESHCWRLGAVLFATGSDGFAAIRKAPVPGERYQFARLWALPGGMGRSDRGPAGAAEELQASLRLRARREAGIDLAQDRALRELPLGPVVTSYHAKRKRRFVLILPYFTEREDADLMASDRSVDEARWISVPPQWETFAPANRVILAHLLWPSLDHDARAQSRKPVAEALKRCALWARRVGIDPVPPPWAEPAQLDAWRARWP